MILVTGATGQLGTAVIHQLVQRVPANHIFAFARNETKSKHLVERGITVCMGTYDDPASLDRAMQGVETVLLIAGTDEENRVAQHQNVVNAAKKASVQRIAYTSRALKNPSTLMNQLMRGHFQTEEYIQASGLNYTLFRNILYMDAIPRFIGGDTVFEKGIYVPAGQGKVAFALRSEMGEAIANALTKPQEGNIIYQLTGSMSYSFYDVAAALTDLVDKSVSYTPAEPTSFEEQLIERGLGQEVARRITGFMMDIAHGQEDIISSDLATLLNRKPIALKEGLAQIFNL